MNIKTKNHHALEYVDDDVALDMEDNLWWVSGRLAIIREHLVKIRTLQKKEIYSIIDVGCGSGGNFKVLSEFSTVTGVEPSPTLSDRAKSRGVAKNVYRDPVWDLNEIKNVNLITSFDVLEHIEDDVDFLSKIKSAAPKHHFVLLSVPACPFLFGDHDLLLSHYRRYSRDSLDALITKAGYNKVSINYYMFFPFPIAFCLRYLDKLKSLFGLKRAEVYVGSVPKPLNFILTKLLKVEALLSKYVPLPIGLWLFAILESKD